MNTWLQIFLFIQIFIAGFLAAVAARYAYAHFRPARPAAQTPKSPAADEYVSPAVKEHLRQASQVQFEAVLKRAAHQLQDELQMSSEQINNLVNHLATEIVSGEMERYRQELSRLQDQANTEMSGIKTAVSKHEAEIKAQMAQEIAAEKQRLLKQIDAKLADAVGSFLLETLGHNVDLGSQSSYLVTMLEEHKADFIKGVGDEVQPK
jgi:F0F1-type ATP synthase membrane subunit b/b'